MSRYSRNVLCVVVALLTATAAFSSFLSHALPARAILCSLRVTSNASSPVATSLWYRWLPCVGAGLLGAVSSSEEEDDDAAAAIVARMQPGETKKKNRVARNLSQTSYGRWVRVQAVVPRTRVVGWCPSVLSCEMVEPMRHVQLRVHISGAMTRGGARRQGDE